MRPQTVPCPDETDAGFEPDPVLVEFLFLFLIYMQTLHCCKQITLQPNGTTQKQHLEKWWLLTYGWVGVE